MAGIKAVSLAALAVAVLAAGRPSSASPSVDPAAELHAHLERLANACARTGLHVEQEDGQVLFSKRADTAFNPASNVKLITAAAVLERLGRQHRFVTELRGRSHGARILGPLYLRGSGDPDLETVDLSDLVAELVREGIRRVDGPIAIDDSQLRTPVDPPGFSAFRSSGPYRAGVSALTLNANVVKITVAPADRPGLPAIVNVWPASGHFAVKSRVRTSWRRSRLRVKTRARGARTGVDVHGRIRVGRAPLHFWKRVRQPAFYAGHTLLALLRAAGLEVRRARVVRKKTPVRAPLLATHLSAPLIDIVRRTTKWSSNVRAELLLLALGTAGHRQPGTYARALRARAAFLRRMGVAPTSYRLPNGSGLTRRALLRPRDMVKVLRGVSRDFRYGPDLLAALPVYGKDGTLRSDFYGRSEAAGSVRAKTGTLMGTLTLSGFVARGGKRLFFSLMTARVHNTWRVRRYHREMLEAMLDYLGASHGPLVTERQ